MANPQLVGAAGASLVLLNTWTGPGRAQLDGLFTSKATAAQTSAAHGELVKIGASFLFVGAAALIASQSQTWGNAMLAMIAALFIIWAINHFAGGAGASTGGGGLNGFTPTQPGLPGNTVQQPGGPLGGLLGQSS